MKKWTLSLAIVLGAGVAGAADPIAFVGEYVWKKGKPHAIRAIFTPTAEGEWEINFRFKHYGKHSWTGTATGDITDGSLAGRVLNPKESREFTFDGVSSNGTFEGTHAELLDSGPRLTGTIVLRREPNTD